jgi:hypothetical protein
MASATQLEGAAPAGQGPLGRAPLVRAPLVRALAQLSAREAWMLAALAMLALVTGAYYAMQWSAGERDRYVAAQADLALAQQTRAGAAHQASGSADLAALAAAEAWSTHARDLWLARLAIEQRLSAAAAAAHLPSPEIKVAEGLETDSDVPLLKAEVSGPFVAAPWLAFMRGLAAEGPALVVDKVDVSDASTAQFTVTLLAPVKLDQVPAAPGADTADAPAPETPPAGPAA